LISKYDKNAGLTAAHGLDLVNPSIWEYKWIWNLDIMPKFKNFFGKFVMHTRGTLAQRGMSIDSHCPFCHTMTEDMTCLFLGYTVSQDYWRLAVFHNWLNMTPLPTQKLVYYKCLVMPERPVMQLKWID